MDAYIASMSQAHRLHRTDLNALAVVMDQTSRGQRVTPRDLGAVINLSTSATSSMLDRLERAGHITRKQHPHDRRSVVVEITELALQTGGRIFGQLGGATDALMSRYSDEDIMVVVGFLEELNGVIQRIAATPDGTS
jgi:DNA-binding MarR family transcriptional regulator